MLYHKHRTLLEVVGSTVISWLTSSHGGVKLINVGFAYTMDAGGGAPAGRSIGDYSYHPGSSRTTSGQASQTCDTAAPVETSVALHCSLQ